MFSWIYKLIGKSAASKLGLTEGIVDTKKWWLSKAVWAAVITVIIGGVQGISTALGHPIVIPQWVLDILVGLGIYGLRTAEKPIA